MNLIEKGRTLVCEIADFDACDKYLFHIDGAGNTLVADWKLKGCGDSGKIKLGKGALDAGTKLIGFSQGSVSRYQDEPGGDECEEGCACHTAPFLLGRKAFASLRDGEEVVLNVFGESATFEKKGKAKREIVIDGKQTSIACIHAQGSDGDLWVVDDETWPLILRVESAGGDNYSELTIATKTSIADAESNLE